VLERVRHRVAIAGCEHEVHHVARPCCHSEHRFANAAHRGRDERERREEHEQRGEEAQHTPPVEGAESDGAGVRLLLEQQRRDQEAREDEEQVDAEEPGRREREVRGVVEDDRGDREGA
jgi:hypothetical protein